MNMENTPLVNFETAKSEVTAWLDYKKVSEAERENKKGAIEAMIKYVMDGTFAIDQTTFAITHSLLFDAAGKKVVTYKPRVTVAEMHMHTKNVNNPFDMQAQQSGILASLTGLLPAEIERMDAEDNKVARVVSSFFM